MLQFAEASASPSAIPSPTSTATAQPSASPAAPQATDALSGTGAWVFVVIVALVVVASGLVTLWARYALRPQAPPDEPGPSLIRSWIAIALVSGLLLFCGAALLVRDTTLRSTLFGGLIASVGAAVAFYFSTNAAAEARRDVLHAAMSATVPDLVGSDAAPRTLGDAQRAISQTPLRLEVTPPAAPADARVTEQSPHAGTVVRSGSTVAVKCAAPGAVRVQ